MKLTGIHFLLTYQCLFECDHCFVWGSPRQSGTFSLEKIQITLNQAQELGTIDWIYFEGGEPFLYYPVLVKAVKLASERGFKVGIVSNAFWATDKRDARTWLRPFTKLVGDLTVSTDLYHYSQRISRQAQIATEVATDLGIPLGVISVAQPESSKSTEKVDNLTIGQLPLGESGVMYRGRAAEKLTQNVPLSPWEKFTECPHEDLREVGRVHLDPLGNLHVCQGISIGNLFETPLKEICEKFNPDTHPIISPLLDGGPAELSRKLGYQPNPLYADACHLCYSARKELRKHFPQVLVPDQMYGIFEE